MIKLSVNETKWSSLLARTRARLLYISIWTFDFGPEKLPGLSRNGPLATVARKMTNSLPVVKPLNQWIKINRGLVSVARTPGSVNHGSNFFLPCVKFNVPRLPSVKMMCPKISETTWQLICFFASFCWWSCLLVIRNISDPTTIRTGFVIVFD